MQKIKNFFLTIWYYFFPTDVMRFEKRLEKEATRNFKQRTKLKKKILRYARKNYGVTGDSKYIRPKGHNPIKIRRTIYANFGKEMKETSLGLSKSLKFSC